MSETEEKTIESGQEIEAWVREGLKDQTCSHVIIVWDDFSDEDYPVYVEQSEDINSKMEEFSFENMQRVMEVYSMKMDIEAQLLERRAYHPEHT